MLLRSVPFAVLAFVFALCSAASAQELPVAADAAPAGQTAIAESPQSLPWLLRRYFEERLQQIARGNTVRFPLKDEPGENKPSPPGQPAWLRDFQPDRWSSNRDWERGKLQKMLGLDPWPARGELKPVITGTIQGEGYTIEKLQFQSLPGLYVTGNLYLPTEHAKPLPTILYVCGHSLVIENGVSLGAKTHYQAHGEWFARHGYVCLIIDTIERGEIRGVHHGTYDLGRWWWPAIGYTPAGVEVWNGIRALDYLETRPEVDRTRIGLTGRSGGGAMSWYIAAMDDRVKVVAPTAGITTLKNHVLDGCIEGHCDCMFMVNTAQWDFDRVAALIAPRPLLIANTDKDEIFPLDGVMEIYQHTRALYQALGEEKKIGLQIAEGPHADTQPLNTGVFHWMDRWLQGASPLDLTDEPAKVRHPAAELKVFAELPKDEKVTTADEWFIPAAEKPPAPTKEEWPKLQKEWEEWLKDNCFAAWPQAAGSFGVALMALPREGPGWTLTHYPPYLGCQEVYVLRRKGVKRNDAENLTLRVLDESSQARFTAALGEMFPDEVPDEAFLLRSEPPELPAEQEDEGAAKRPVPKLKVAKAVPASMQPWLPPKGMDAIAYVVPRFCYLNALSPKKRTQILRRFQLLGETLESGQVFDIGEAINTLLNYSQAPKPVTLRVKASGQMAVNAIYAAIYCYTWAWTKPSSKPTAMMPSDERVFFDLRDVPATQKEGPIYLNVLRRLDVPQALALAAAHHPVKITTAEPEAFAYPRAVASALGWKPERLQIVGMAPKITGAPNENISKIGSRPHTFRDCIRFILDARW